MQCSLHEELNFKEIVQEVEAVKQIVEIIWEKLMQDQSHEGSSFSMQTTQV